MPYCGSKKSTYKSISERITFVNETCLYSLECLSHIQGIDPLWLCIKRSKSKPRAEPVKIINELRIADARHLVYPRIRTCSCPVNTIEYCWFPFYIFVHGLSFEIQMILLVASYIFLLIGTKINSYLVITCDRWTLEHVLTGPG